MPKPILDLTGQRYGQLLVLESPGIKNRHRQWRCACDCGNKTTVGVGALRSGNTKSCGCQGSRKTSKFKDRTGQRFGRLVVLSRDGNDKHRHPIWICRCDCGKETKVSRVNLINGSIKSCGCLQDELRHRKGPECPNWKGGSAIEAERIRASEEYKNWRTSVFTRDDFLCQECGAGGKIQAHHIKAFAAFPDLRFEISNGQTLCVPCHRKTPTYLNRHQKII